MGAVIKVRVTAATYTVACVLGPFHLLSAFILEYEPFGQAAVCNSVPTEYLEE